MLARGGSLIPHGHLPEPEEFAMQHPTPGGGDLWFSPPFFVLRTIWAAPTTQGKLRDMTNAKTPLIGDEEHFRDAGRESCARSILAAHRSGRTPVHSGTERLREVYADPDTVRQTCFWLARATRPAWTWCYQDSSAAHGFIRIINPSRNIGSRPKSQWSG